MGQYCYDYPRPAVTVDIAVFQWREQAIRILLIQRAGEPFAGQWALPGGFVDMQETAAEAAARELREETGLANLDLREVGVFDAPQRDPRGRTISVAYLAAVPADQPVEIRSGDDAAAAKWFDLRSLPALAFDHAEVIARTLRHLQMMTMYWMDGLRLLPQSFTLADLHSVHEAVLGQRISESRLQACLQEWGILEQAESRASPKDAADLFRINWKKLARLRQESAFAVLAAARERP